MSETGAVTPRDRLQEAIKQTRLARRDLSDAGLQARLSECKDRLEAVRDDVEADA